MEQKVAQVKFFRSEKSGKEAMEDVESQMNAYLREVQSKAGHGIVHVYPKKFEDVEGIGIGEKWFGEIWRDEELAEDDTARPGDGYETTTKTEITSSTFEVPMTERWQDEGIAKVGNDEVELRFADKQPQIIPISMVAKKKNDYGIYYTGKVPTEGLPMTLFERKYLTPPFKWGISVLRKRPIQ